MIKRVKPFYKTDWLLNLGKYIKQYDFWHDGIIEEFEKKTLEVVYRKYALAVNSGSNAIFMALWCWKNMNPGRYEVIIPNWGYPAAFKVCDVLGLVPVPVDMDKENLSMTLDEVYLNLKNETLAVIHIENNGVIGGAKEIGKMINDPRILYIEDSAPSLLQENAGMFGDVAIFSSSPTKPLISGEGGVIVTDDLQLYMEMKQLRHLSDYKDKNPSLNFMLSPFLAAYLINQFDYLNDMATSRIVIHNCYKRHGLNIFEESSNCHGAIMYMSPKAEKISEKLNQFGIEHRYKYYPLYSENKKMFPISHEIRKQIIDLPMHYDLDDDKIKFICEVVKRGENE